jgi:hypothetical protein
MIGLLSDSIVEENSVGQQFSLIERSDSATRQTNPDLLRPRNVGFFYKIQAFSLRRRIEQRLNH